MQIYDRIRQLCNDHGVTVTGLEKTLGFARGSLCKIDRNKPSTEKAQKIADFFGVSVTYLMTGEQPVHHLNDETAELARELFENRELLGLMQSARKLTPEALRSATKLFENMKGTNPDG